MALLDPFSITVRLLETREEYDACVTLQRATWGERFADCVPATILMITQRIGGVTAGAFDSDGRLLGFVFGITGVRDGRPVHWSDMLAVHHDARGLGLGKRLKAYQREVLLKKGVEMAYWTYDPLVARNAHLNLNTLGARPIEYVPNMYGDTGSSLHIGLDTDRLVVEWPLADPQVERILAGQPPAAPRQADDAPIVTVSREAEVRLGGAPWVRVEIPADILRLKVESLDRSRAWQRTVREAFLHYLPAGYRVAAFYRDAAEGRCFYVLTSEHGASM